MSFDARILVVDDDPNSRYMLTLQLRRMGYTHTLEANSGEEALAMARQAPPDIMLLDVMMAGVDGMEVLRRWREAGVLAECPVIMISANPSLELMARSIEMGAEDYMHKPVDRVLLGARLQATLEKRRLRRVETAFAAHFDPSTGLPNRSNLIEKVDLFASSHQPYALSVVVMRDHAARALGEGETRASSSLKQMADYLVERVLGGDTVARVADDSLAWLAGGEQRQDSTLVDDIQAVLSRRDRDPAEPAPAPEGSLMATAGVVFVEQGQAMSPEDALRLVMSAAVNVPLDASRRVVVANQDLRESMRETLQLYQELERALQHGELVPYFQPQYRVRDRSLVGAEALLRWRHGERGLLTPGQFLHIASRGPLLDAIDRHVLTQACHFLNAHGALLPDPFTLSVNITAPSLIDGVALRVIQRTLDPRWTTRLQLELTEHAVIEDVRRCVAALEPIRRLGVSVALDDFGTGYSSISHLHQIPCETLKIDRSFVDGVDYKPHTRKLLQAMVAMAHTLDIEVVAEGVEREEELQVLRSIGCEKVQGYLLSRPIPPEALRDMLRRVATQHSLG